MYDDNDPKEAAHDFFAKLRAFDKSGVDVIIAWPPSKRTAWDLQS